METEYELLKKVIRILKEEPSRDLAMIKLAKREFDNLNKKGIRPEAELVEEMLIEAGFTQNQVKYIVKQLKRFLD